MFLPREWAGAGTAIPGASQRRPAAGAGAEPSGAAAGQEQQRPRSSSAFLLTASLHRLLSGTQLRRTFAKDSTFTYIKSRGKLISAL